MKKLVLSVGAVVATYSLVASTAAAMFLTTAQFTGMQLETTSLALKVSADGHDSPVYHDTAVLDGSYVLQPGMNPHENFFWLKTENSAGQQVTLSAYMEGGSGDWEALQNLILIRIEETTSGVGTDWLTLKEWQQSHALPVPTMSEGEQRKYVMLFDLLDSYVEDPDGSGPIQSGDPVGNEAMGLGIHDIRFVINAAPTKF